MFKKNNEDNKLNQNDFAKTLKVFQRKKEKQEAKNNKLLSQKINEIQKSKIFDRTKIAELVLLYERLKKGRQWKRNPVSTELYYYDQGYWKRDLTKEQEIIKKTISKTLRKIKRSWNKRSKINEISDEIEIIISDIENEKLFDPGTSPNLDLINVKNGMLDWKSNDLKPHDHNYHSIFQLNVKYNPDATYEKWQEALDSWIPEKRTQMFLQEFAGYMLIPDTSFDKAVILYGSGSNGKSTFLTLLKNLFGKNNLSSHSIDKFTDKNQSRWTTRYVMDKLVNICSDMGPNYLTDTGVIKTMIAGETTPAEIKFGAAFEFIPVTRFIFSANELPKSRDKSEGWYRRLEFVEFPNHFAPSDKSFDRNLDLKLYRELPGIFNWALEGLKRLYEKEIFTISNSMRRSKAEYRDDNDPIRAFIEENLVHTEDLENDYIVTQKVYEDYQRWSTRNGYPKYETKNTFSRVMKRNGFKVKPKSIKSTPKRCYLGIKYKE